MGRLEAIPNIGQGPVGDGAHGIKQVTLVELAFDLNINNTTAGIGGVCGVRWGGGHGFKKAFFGDSGECPETTFILAKIWLFRGIVDEVSVA